MRVGFFRRTGSYLLDIIPIFTIVSLLLNLFVGDMLKPIVHEDFDRLETMYYENLEEYEAIIDPLYAQYTDGEITYDEYVELATPYQEDFIHNNIYLYDVVFINYWITVAIYLVISLNVLYYVYLLLTKGNTYGRRLLKIELQGKVTWYNLLLREIIWKHFFWYVTLSAGIAVDLGLIAFTKKKRTIRDIFSGTYLAHQGVQYPF